MDLSAQEPTSDNLESKKSRPMKSGKRNYYRSSTDVLVHSNQNNRKLFKGNNKGRKRHFRYEIVNEAK